MPWWLLKIFVYLISQIQILIFKAGLKPLVEMMRLKLNKKLSVYLSFP